MNIGWKKLVAEFFGTMILVVVAVGVATESFGFKLHGLSFAAGVVATAFAFGAVLIALVYAIGPISGCHVNPAVTIGFVSSGRMKVEEGIVVLDRPGRRRHRGRVPPLLDVHDLAAVPQEHYPAWAPTDTAGSRTCSSARAGPS